MNLLFQVGNPAFILFFEFLRKIIIHVPKLPRLATVIKYQTIVKVDEFYRAHI